MSSSKSKSKSSTSKTNLSKKSPKISNNQSESQHNNSNNTVDVNDIPDNNNYTRLNLDSIQDSESARLAIQNELSSYLDNLRSNSSVKMPSNFDTVVQDFIISLL